MKANKRFVFDTNTLISAAIFKNSIPAKALKAAIASGFLLLFPETRGEFLSVLTRTKFDRYLTSSERVDFVEFLTQYHLLIDEVSHVVACRDPKDDKFLALAVAASASAIVTGDNDLLVLHPFRGIAIVTPADFLAY